MIIGLAFSKTLIPMPSKIKLEKNSVALMHASTLKIYPVFAWVRLKVSSALDIPPIN